MNNPPHGFYKTEFGFLPLDWSCLPLGELVHNVSYGSSAKSDVKGLVPVLRMGNLQNGFIDWKGLVYSNNNDEIKKYELEMNDVLFNRTNTVDLVGKTAIYKGDYPAIYAGYLIKINNKNELLNSDFLNYVLNTHQAKSYSRLILSVAVSQANINGQKLKTYPIPRPPTIEEQTAIANALSDVDALLCELEKLIAKKQAIKTATMQQLLTGKTRLPAFAVHSEPVNEGSLHEDLVHKCSPHNTTNHIENTLKGQPKGTKPSELGEIPEDWEVVQLKNITLDMLQGINTAIDKPEYVDAGIPILKANNIIDQIVSLKNVEQISQNSYSKYSQRYTIKKGDFLFSNIGARLGTGSLWELNTTSTFAWNVMRIIPDQKRILPKFLAQLINSPKQSEKIQSEQSGSGMGFIPKNTMQNISLLLPKLQEQTAIANILSDMDSEIQALTQRLAKTRQIKQGMMQALLTGKIRLPFEKSNSQGLGQ